LLLYFCILLSTSVSAQQYPRNDDYSKRAWDKQKTDVGINSLKGLPNKQLIKLTRSDIVSRPETLFYLNVEEFINWTNTGAWLYSPIILLQLVA